MHEVFFLWNSIGRMAIVFENRWFCDHSNYKYLAMFRGLGEYDIHFELTNDLLYLQEVTKCRFVSQKQESRVSIDQLRTVVEYTINRQDNQKMAKLFEQSYGLHATQEFITDVRFVSYTAAKFGI